MVPARNLRRRHCDSYGAYFSGGDSHFHDLDGSSSLKLNCSMADEPSPAPEDEQRRRRDGVELGYDNGSSRDWLQLGLATPPPAPSDHRPERMTTTQLELFPGRLSSSSSSSVSPASLTYPVAWPGIGGFRAPVMGMAMTMMPWMSHRQEMAPWGRWNHPNLAVGGSSTTTMLQPVVPQFVARQFMYPISRSASPSMPEVRQDVRVVSPPRRPQSGVWVMLQAVRNQGREPFLPQIPKCYLRIKDGRMTVRLLMKYLVNKLGLEDESEVEITCRGQILPPVFTLQHVRDNVWCCLSSREATTTALLHESPTTADHVMALHYSRSAHVGTEPHPLRASASCII